MYFCFSARLSTVDEVDICRPDEPEVLLLIVVVAVVADATADERLRETFLGEILNWTRVVSALQQMMGEKWRKSWFFFRDDDGDLQNQRRRKHNNGRFWQICVINGKVGRSCEVVRNVGF